MIACQAQKLNLNDEELVDMRVSIRKELKENIVLDMMIQVSYRVKKLEQELKKIQNLRLCPAFKVKQPEVFKGVYELGVAGLYFRRIPIVSTWIQLNSS